MKRFFAVKADILPGQTLLESYRTLPGAYTDCFSIVIDRQASHPEFVIAFYTSFLFKIERVILKIGIDKPSSDSQAKELAEGHLDHFAAWTVEQRESNQLLMCDCIKRTRSWLMVEPDLANNTSRTKLYFGTAIVPTEELENGQRQIGKVYQRLLGFHKLYSRLLLAAAVAKL